MVITRVGPMSCAKVAALLYFVIGLVAGAFISLASMVGAFASDQPEGAVVGAAFGIGAVVLLPILYGCFGFVGTLFMTWLFNVIVGITGGIEVEAR